MKNYSLVLALVLLSNLTSFAQDKNDSNNVRPLNNINIVYLGRVSWISINYERLFLINPHFFIAGEIGIGSAHEFSMGGTPPPTHTTITQQITGNYGGKKNFVEFGFIGTKINNYQFQNYVVCPVIGYRLQPLKSGKANFKVLISHPLFGFDQSAPGKGGESLWFSPIGINVGLIF